MSETNNLRARSGDLLLTIDKRGTSWQVCVEEADDPNSALSGGTDYSSVEKAKEGAISIALELFGTKITAAELNWEPVSSH
jgi:hypothetical protein